MFASKRSIRKAAIVKGEFKPKEQPKHNNKKITPGREHRIQQFRDKHGFVTGQIVQYGPRRLKKLEKYNKLMEEYNKAYLAEHPELAEQMEAQKASEGQVPILNETGKDLTGDNEVEAPKLEES